MPARSESMIRAIGTAISSAAPITAPTARCTPNHSAARSRVSIGSGPGGSCSRRSARSNARAAAISSSRVPLRNGGTAAIAAATTAISRTATRLAESCATIRASTATSSRYGSRITAPSSRNTARR